MSPKNNVSSKSKSFGKKKKLNKQNINNYRPYVRVLCLNHYYHPPTDHIFDLKQLGSYNLNL